MANTRSPRGGRPSGVGLHQRLGRLQANGLSAVQHRGGGLVAQGPTARRGRPPAGARPVEGDPQAACTGGR
eukprot:10628659-Lingulodinium_polyedra.AAC.1